MPSNTKANESSGSDTQSSKDSTSKNYLERQYKNLSKITFADWVFVLVGIVFLVLCLTGGLTGFFVMKNDQLIQDNDNFQRGALDITFELNKNMDEITSDLLMIRTMLSLFDGVTFYKQFLPFTSSLSSVTYSNGDVELKDYIKSYNYIQIVDNNNLTNYFSTIRSWGGLYSNISNVKEFGATGKLDVVRSEYFLVTLYLPLNGNISTNLGSNPLRNRTLQAARASKQIIVSDKVTIAGVVGDASGVITYAPVVKNNVTVGFISSSMLLKNLMNASTTLDNQQGLAMLDDKNNVMTIFTNGIKIGKEDGNYTFSDVEALLSQSMFRSPYHSITLYNKQYKIICFSTARSSSYYKAIPLCVCLVVLLIIEVGLVSVCGYRRVVVVKRMQDVTRDRVGVLENHRTKLSSLLKKSVKSEAKSRSIINSIPDIVVVVNMVGKILQSNKNFDKLFEFNEQEWTAGVMLSSILVELDPMFFESADDKLVNTFMKTKDVDKIGVQVKVSSIIDDSLLDAATPTIMKNVTLKYQKHEDSEGDQESYVIIISIVHQSDVVEL
ncbi:geranylgeranyl diphosphate synthase [Acrasis kona]|uniref:Geranylgeranyl diphosphate synthase n=1 Tax=Acrasis kona TaxID=1008807 RepID=A0AAW2Z1K4_9EUKA